MSDIAAHTKVEMGSERNFGLVFGVVFLILTIVGLVFSGWYWPYTTIISLVFFTLAFAFPSILRVPNRLWFRFGLLLHSIISPVVMFLVFAVTFIPLGLIFRLRGRDLLEQDFDPDRASYWDERSEPPGKMTRQF